MPDSTSPPSQSQGTPKDPAVGAIKETGAVSDTLRQSSEYRVTCVSCRQRKVKCSKTHPCVACDRSGLSCIFPDRARLPRGRKRSSKATNGEILKRLYKLEELLAQSKNGQEEDSGQKGREGESAGKTSETSGPKVDNGSWTGSIGPNCTKENTVTVREEGVGGLDRYLGSQFWNNLASEVSRLKL